MRGNYWVERAKHRAKRLRAGENLSSKETAKLLCDVAQELEKLCRKHAAVQELENRLAIAEAWRAGFEARRPSQ